MNQSHTPPAMPLRKTLLVLLGFPLVSTLLSLLLLRRTWLTDLGLDFFSIFWLLILVWYVVQIAWVWRIAHGQGWTWADLGLGLRRKQLFWMIGGYLALAFGLMATVELVLASADMGPEQWQALSDLSNLTPKTINQRVIYILAGLVAGFAEELVYRGFAIGALKRSGLPNWLAVVSASIPFVFQHGLKSLDQFWWFFIWGLVFGALYLLTKRRLAVTIIIHWLVILSALLAILQVLE